MSYPMKTNEPERNAYRAEKRAQPSGWLDCRRAEPRALKLEVGVPAESLSAQYANGTPSSRLDVVNKPAEVSNRLVRIVDEKENMLRRRILR